MKKFTFVYWKKDGSQGRWSRIARFKEELADDFYYAVETEDDFDELDTILEEEPTDNEYEELADLVF